MELFPGSSYQVAHGQGCGQQTHLVAEHDQDLAAQDEALQAAGAAGALPCGIELAAVLIVAQAAAHHRKAVVPAPRQHLHDVVHPLDLPEAPAGVPWMLPSHPITVRMMQSTLLISVKHLQAAITARIAPCSSGNVKTCLCGTSMRCIDRYGFTHIHVL